MTFAMWAALVTAYLVSVVIFLGWWHAATTTAARHEPRPWFDHQQFRDGLTSGCLVDRVKEYTRTPVIAYPCSYGGDLLEFPIAGGWDEDAILGTLAEIEAL